MSKKIYRQYDSRWGGLPYPTKKINLSNSGCGCLAVYHVAIENPKYKDLTVKQCWRYMKQFSKSGQGTDWVGIKNGLEHYGYKVHWKQSDGMTEIFKALEKSTKMGVILFHSGKAPNGTVWTSSGHYVAFTDYKISKKTGRHLFYCLDSGERKNDGWKSYEKSMRGCVKFVYVCKSMEKESKPKPKPTPKPEAKKPTVPSLKIKKSNAAVINDTVDWAKWIAKNNDFHYGHGEASHHNGCYFCGTNSKFKEGHGIKGWRYTSCCNPFVNSAWAHGGCVKPMLELCRKCHSYGFAKGEGYDASPLFKYLGLLPNYKRSNLKRGDVICTPSHVMLYIGDGQVCHAGYEDDNVIGSKKWNKSICIEDLRDSWHYKRQYNAMRVYRYTGSVDTNLTIRFGEHSYRIKQLQECLKYLKYKVAVDGYYGEETLKAVKKFKAKHGLNDSGAVAEKTLAALKKAVRG